MQNRLADSPTRQADHHWDSRFANRRLAEMGLTSHQILTLDLPNSYSRSLDYPMNRNRQLHVH
jgi:hypothetical protein